MGSSSEDERAMLGELKEQMNEFFLKQLIDRPTHKDGNVLDLLLINNTNIVHSYHCVPILNEISHHAIIEVATVYRTKFNEELSSGEYHGII